MVDTQSDVRVRSNQSKDRLGEERGGSRRSQRLFAIHDGSVELDEDGGTVGELWRGYGVRCDARREAEAVQSRFDHSGCDGLDGELRHVFWYADAFAERGHVG